MTKPADSQGWSGSAHATEISWLSDPVEASRRLLVGIAIESGLRQSDIHAGRRVVPGHFTQNRIWNLGVTVQDRDLAIISVDSDVVDNRPEWSDRILAKSIDIRSATDTGDARPLRPWVGYIVLTKRDITPDPAHDHDASLSSDPAFDSLKHIDRVAILLRRLVSGRLLDAACAAQLDTANDSPTSPDVTLTLQAFMAAFAGRCVQFTVAHPELVSK